MVGSASLSGIYRAPLERPRCLALRRVPAPRWMASLGLGTVPSLLLLAGLGGASLAGRGSMLARRLPVPWFLFNALALSAMAVGVAAPP